MGVKSVWMKGNPRTQLIAHACIPEVCAPIVSISNPTNMYTILGWPENHIIQLPIYESH